ncbi:MAG: Holliday junction DNA helicase RuvA [Algoriphagus sp.]|jgi:Holliday junction DNA helicase RuvA
MITYLNGDIVEKDPTFLVMEVAGIGYEVKISLNTYGHLKDVSKTKLHTHLHIKEDAHTLFGFHEESEKKRFLDLISISGVGPSTALMVLSSLSAEELQSAIVNGDTKTISSVKGIGLKTAQRIILELKDKISKEDLLDKAVGISLSKGNTVKNEALSALATLGINKAAAEKSIDRIMKEKDGNVSLEELIKLALKRA